MANKKSYEWFINELNEKGCCPYGNNRRIYKYEN